MVSVILPNYNHSAYLKERIDSILAQTYRDFEIIILDDKSTDNSIEIIEGYRDNEKVSHIVYNETNSGSTFKQWDKGFALAKGEYVWIAESDDYADPTFMERCIEQLNAYPDVVFCYCDSNLVDERGEKISHPIEGLIDPDYGKDMILSEGKEFIKASLSIMNKVYNASMVIFRKEYIKRINPTYKIFRYSGDWLFWVEMAAQGRVVRVTKKLNYFRQHSNKVSSSKNRGSLPLYEASYILTHIFIMLYADEKCNTLIDRGIKSFTATEMALFFDNVKKNRHIRKKLLFYIMGRINNVLHKMNGGMSKREIEDTKRELRLVWYAPIAGFLIKNSKSLTRSLTK